MIKAMNLTKEYNNTVLFKDISFHITNGSKIAFIGRNGAGKSTLFRILCGLEKPTNGGVELSGEKIAYLTQEFDFPKECLVGEFFETVAGTNGDSWRVEKIAGQLGLNTDPYRYIDTLSGGEKMRLKLAQLLYGNPTALLLDEPTNHLDIIGIQWLKSFLNTFKGTVLMISHDRDLINDTVNMIYELDQGTLLKFSGNYNDYINQKERWIELKAMEYNRFVEKKKRLEILLKKAQTGEIRSRSGSATAAAKKRYEREVTKREVKQYERKEYSDFNISGSVHNTKLVLRVSNLDKSYGERKVLDDISFEIRGNEKIWLFGENGMGKTTLVKCILGLENIDSGSIQIGENINIGYFEQKQKPIEIETKLIDYYMENAIVDYYSAPSILSRYLFTDDDLDKPVRLLSPGQQARLKFALFAEQSTRKQYQLLILDEPAQHLDIETKEIVERTINEFKGAIILISHDMYSIQKIDLDKVFKLEKSKLYIQTEFDV